nr:VP2 [Ulaatai Melophagus solemo-like virus]
MEPAYRGCAVEVDHFDTYDHFRKCLAHLDFQATPGYPFMGEKSTIGEWLGFNGVTFDELQVEKLWLMVNDLLVSDEIDCLWRVFIKQEPHKLKKIQERRYRLIMCPPLHVQVLWQMLFMEQNAKEIEMAYHIPSQQGMMLPYGHWKIYYDQWRSQGTTSGTDAQAWDWTVPGWIFKLDLEFRKRQARGLRVDQWMVQTAKLYRNAFRDAKLLFSNGRVFQQLSWGVMKSGCVNTISTNSHGGVFYHILYCLIKNIPVYPLPKVCGDDKLSHPMHVDDIEVYQRYGYVVKSISPTIEFVGHEFHPTGPRPMYIGKHVFNFLYSDDTNMEDMLESYLRLNALYDDGFNFWMSIAKELGLVGKVLSRNYYRSWYNSPDGARFM